MATQIHGFGPNGELSPGAASALAGLGGGGGGASTLNDLTDVDTTGATTGQVLTFDGSEWSPDAPSAGTVTSTSISDSTATGRAVLTAADAATARTAIGAGTSNLAIGTTGSTAAAGNRTASTTATGMVELATTTETTTGTDSTRAVTPAGVKAVVDALTIPDSPDDIGAAPAAAGVPSGGTTGQVLGKASAADHDTTWVDQIGGGGGGPSILDLYQTRAVLGPPQDTWVPTATIGGHATFSMVAGRLIPCPALLNRSVTVDKVGVRVETGVADVTIELALYSWDEAAGTSAHIETLGTVDASTSGLKTAAFTPIPLSRGVYVVVGRAIGDNVTVWARSSGLLMLGSGGPSAGTNPFTFPHATGASMPATITWDWAAGVGSLNGAFPALQIGASA